MIDVVFASDVRFAEHVAVALASVAANASDPSRVRAWIVVPAGAEDHPTVDACRRAARPLDVRVVAIDLELVAEAPLSRHITRASYFRLHLPSVLPPEVGRYVYLDADLVVESDLEALASCSMQGRPVAAVLDGYLRRRRLPGMRPSAPYLNAGVLLVDRAAWQATDLTARCREVIADLPALLDYHDQDALNLALDGDWAPLDARWNQQSVFWERSARRLGVEPRSLARALDDPGIVHFSGASKPWEYTNVHPLRGRYLHYRRLAGLSAAGGEPGSFRDVAVRTLRRAVSLRHRRVLRAMGRHPLRIGGR